MLTEEQRKMVEENHSLIFGFCRTYQLDVDEVYDILSIALCRSAMGYDPAQGQAFSTYVFQVFRRAVGRERQRNFRQKRIPESKLVSLSEPVKSVSVGADEAMTLGECIEDSSVYFNRRLFLQDFLNWAENHLSEKEMNTIKYILAGLTQQEIADLEHITYQGVQLRIKSIVKKVKRADCQNIRDIIDGLRVTSVDVRKLRVN